MIGQFETMKYDPLISDVHKAIYFNIMHRIKATHYPLILPPAMMKDSLILGPLELQIQSMTLKIRLMLSRFY